MYNPINTINTGSIGSPHIGQPMTSPLGNPVLGLQNMMQHSLLSQYTTGNPLIDPLISVFIYTSISIFIYNIQSIFNFTNIKYYLDKLYGLFIFYFNIFCRNGKEKITKTVVIDYITETKKINNLYKAVEWYIMNNEYNDYSKESMLKYSFDKEIDTIDPKKPEEPININTRVMNDRYKTIKYNDVDIYYVLSTNLISIFGDKERKKENYSITLNYTSNNDSTIDILDKFSKYCLKKYAKSFKSSTFVQKIYVNNENGEWKPQDSNNRRSLDTIILKGNMLDDIKDDINDFVNSEKWYHQRDIPFKRSYLLYGKPGCGKTSVIKGISSHTKRHMHYLMLNNVMSDTQLLEIMNKINYKETILIIEDIDCMTNIIESRDKNNDKDTKTENDTNTDDSLKDKISALEDKINSLDPFRPYNTYNTYNKSIKSNQNEKSALTLSGLLNAIDGVFDCDGRIMIMTTNHPEILDNALTRAGRIDRKIYFDTCDIDQIQRIFEMMYDIKVSDLHISQLHMVHNDMVQNNKVYTPADVTSLFLRYKNDPDNALLNFDKIEEFDFVKQKLFPDALLVPNSTAQKSCVYDSMIVGEF